MHCLQMCVSECVKRAERGAESDGLPEAVEEAQEVLKSLVDRMTETELEDFELVREEGMRDECVCVCVCVCMHATTAGQVCRLLCWE